MSEQDRRSARRVPFVADVTYSVDGVDFERRAFDLSVGGIYLEDRMPPEEGQPIVVAFEVDGHRITAAGRVVFSDAPIGFGAYLDGLSDEDREVMRRYVAAHR